MNNTILSDSDQLLLHNEIMTEEWLSRKEPPVHLRFVPVLSWFETQHALCFHGADDTGVSLKFASNLNL